MEELDLVKVARLVHAMSGCDATDREGPASLFGVGTTSAGECEISLLGRGPAIEILEWTSLHPGADAIVLCLAGWIVRDLEPGDVRPSLHPFRRRVAMTAAIGGRARPEIVIVIRVGDAPEEVLVGGEGEIPDALRRSWSQMAGNGYTNRTKCL